MLDEPFQHGAPYALFTLDPALPEARCEELDALFLDETMDWTRHTDPLYQCWISDVTERLDGAWLRALARRMAAHTGLDLTDAVQVSAQHMEPGDHIGGHTDRPLLGYEVARLVVLLDRDWNAGDGGLFRAFDGEVAALEMLPRRNAGVGFALTATSLHEVTRTQRARRTVVFSFFHPGNDAAVERLVRGLFADMSFGSLPEEVMRLADVAEAERAELDTYRAATVAVALLAWGYDAEEAAAGYLAALGEPAPPVSEIDAATAIARWLSRLHVGDFDVAAWGTLRRRLGPLDLGQRERIRGPWSVAFDRVRDRVG